MPRLESHILRQSLDVPSAARFADAYMRFCYREVGTQHRIFNPLIVDKTLTFLLPNGSVRIFSRNQNILFAHLLNSPGDVFTYDQLKRMVHGNADYEDNAIIALVDRVRTQLEPNREPKTSSYIHNVPAVGYYGVMSPVIVGDIFNTLSEIKGHALIE